MAARPSWRAPMPTYTTLAPCSKMTRARPARVPGRSAAVIESASSGAFPNRSALLTDRDLAESRGDDREDEPPQRRATEVDGDVHQAGGEVEEDGVDHDAKASKGEQVGGQREQQHDRPDEDVDDRQHH